MGGMGYGYVKTVSKGNGRSPKMEHAHRVAWRLTNGEIPPGMFVCHRCDNPRCVRPDHLFLGAPSDNSGDMVEKARQATGTRNGNAKLNPQRVQEIREANGTVSALARRFEVSRKTIRNIRKGETWKTREPAPQPPTS